MTLTVRLDPHLEDRFNQLVREERRTKSEVVTELLTRYVEARVPKTAYKVALEVGVFDFPGTNAPRALARITKKPWPLRWLRSIDADAAVAGCATGAEAAHRPASQVLRIDARIRPA